MPNSTAKSMMAGIFGWHETAVENLREGSRFRLISCGSEPEPDDNILFVVLHRNKGFLQVFATEWIDGKKIETSFRELSLKDSSLVMVIPDHDQMIASSRAK